MCPRENRTAVLIDKLLNQLNMKKPKAVNVLCRYYSDTGKFIQKVNSEEIKRLIYCCHLDSG